MARIVFFVVIAHNNCELNLLLISPTAQLPSCLLSSVSILMFPPPSSFLDPHSISPKVSNKGKQIYCPPPPPFSAECSLRKRLCLNVWSSEVTSWRGSHRERSVSCVNSRRHPSMNLDAICEATWPNLEVHKALMQLDFIKDKAFRLKMCHFSCYFRMHISYYSCRGDELKLSYRCTFSVPLETGTWQKSVCRVWGIINGFGFLQLKGSAGLNRTTLGTWVV